MPYDGAFHCFMHNIVRGQEESNKHIIRVAQAAWWKSEYARDVDMQ